MVVGVCSWVVKMPVTHLAALNMEKVTRVVPDLEREAHG